MINDKQKIKKKIKNHKQKCKTKYEEQKTKN